MNVDWTYDGCDPDDQRAIAKLWQDYQAELEAKIAELSVGPSELRLAITHESETDGWELQAALHLPTRTLAAERSGPSLEGVFDRTVADLVRAVNEEEGRPVEVSRRLQGLEAILPLLESNHAQGRSHQFFTFLRPLVQTLRTYTERELELLELEGAHPLETLEVDDVLDEVLLQAWDRFAQRPKDVPIDLWLISLIHELLNAAANGVRHLSLEDERDVALPEQDEQSSPVTWIEQAAYPETIELGDLLPGDPGVDLWDRLDLETRQTKLSELLSYLSREHRQILVLHAVECFEPEQIAALQGRTLADVDADLEASRKLLKAALKNIEHKPKQV
jgi:DNA-directed RNA polymerase specialized sigma24 family protein